MKLWDELEMRREQDECDKVLARAYWIMFGVGVAVLALIWWWKA